MAIASRLNFGLAVYILPLSYMRILYRAPSMPHPNPLVTTVSTKGQVILPKTIRERRDWDAGTRLTVEETPDGVLLRRAPVFAPSRPDEVYALLPHRGDPKSVEDMDAAILAEAKRRHDRD